MELPFSKSDAVFNEGPLQDLLTFNDGSPVVSSEDWRRRLDQHFLSALVAPRGLRFQIAFADTWANGVGACENYRETMKVYKLLGAEENFSIAFREGPHNHTPADWNHSLDFAQAFFERNGK